MHANTNSIANKPSNILNITFNAKSTSLRKNAACISVINNTNTVNTDIIISTGVESINFANFFFHGETALTCDELVIDELLLLLLLLSVALRI